jgi:hypothetical protein
MWAFLVPCQEERKNMATRVNQANTADIRKGDPPQDRTMQPFNRHSTLEMVIDLQLVWMSEV